MRFRKLEFDQISDFFSDFYTYFKYVAKNIKRCWNAFTFICNLVPKLVKSSYGWLPIWLHQKTDKKEIRGGEGGGQSLILLQIQHQFAIRCLFITFGGKQLLDDQGLTMQDFACNHILMTKIPLILNKHHWGSSTNLLILQEWRWRKMLAAQLILYIVKRLQYCMHWPVFLFHFCDEAWVVTNP